MILTQSGRLKVLDFGLAVRLRSLKPLKRCDLRDCFDLLDSLLYGRFNRPVPAGKAGDFYDKLKDLKGEYEKITAAEALKDLWFTDLDFGKALEDLCERLREAELTKKP
eukprot:Trichotokara_eunicae@DN6345_c2_g1_i6.p1